MAARPLQHSEAAFLHHRRGTTGSNPELTTGHINRDFHFGRPGLAPYTPKTFCLDRFAVAAHWACPLNRQRAVREGLAEQTAVVLGRFFDTSPTLRPVRLEFPILSLHPGLRPRCVAPDVCPTLSRA